MTPKNRKFLAQKEKEDLQKRIIIIATISVLAIVFGLVVYGVIDRYVLTPKQTVISLEGETIKADEFEQHVRWQRRGRINEIGQILMTIQQLGNTPEVYSYFENQLMVSVNQLEQPLLIGQEVLQVLSQELILRIEAQKLGIEIDDARIDKEIQLAFGFFADGTPTPQATLEIPESTEGEEDDTQPVDDDETPDPTATPLLIPTEYTEELFESNYQEFVDSLKDYGIKEKTVRDYVMMTVIHQEIRDIVTNDVEQTQEQVWIQHILVEDEETALEVLEKLDEGDEFDDLAAEYSLDQSNAESGGDLGWFGPGQMVLPFEVAAFALEEGEISDPIQTDYGWHILKSNGKEERLLEINAYEQLRNQAFSEWLTEKEVQYQPEINEKWSKFVPSEPSLPPDYLAFIQSMSQGQLLVPTEAPQ
jgi:peptidyl-prolyl cis-trans isomerase D